MRCNVTFPQGIMILSVLDHVTMAFFTIEYVVRFLCAPKKCKFVKSPLNIVDIMAILPYFIGFLLEGFKVIGSFTCKCT